MTPNPTPTPPSAQGESRGGSYWLLLYEDSDVKPEIFTDQASAEARYEQAKVSWAVHLFRSVAPTPPACAAQSKLCDTTLTERFVNPNCKCATYEGNLGPCRTFELGASGRCAYCDHEKDCHAACAAQEGALIPDSAKVDAGWIIASHASGEFVSVETAERLLSEIREELEELRQFKAEVDAEGTVPASVVQLLDNTADERDAALAELTRLKSCAAQEGPTPLVNDPNAPTRADLERQLAESRAECDRLKAERQWRSIETAPQSGRWVLLWGPDLTDAAVVGYYAKDSWRTAPGGKRWSSYASPTHWMPLPAAKKEDRA